MKTKTKTKTLTLTKISGATKVALKSSLVTAIP